VQQVGSAATYLLAGQALLQHLGLVPVQGLLLLLGLPLCSVVPGTHRLSSTAQSAWQQQAIETHSRGLSNTSHPDIHAHKPQPQIATPEAKEVTSIKGSNKHAT
jgi:hypothetical protein